MICEKCHCEHDGTYGSGRFCSRSCANSRIKNDVIKEKISKTLLERRKLGIFKTNFEERFCKDCGKKLGFRNKSGYCHNCIQKHINARDEVKEKHRKVQLDKIANGTHKGWNSRNIKSYAEVFWENVLNNNNIHYIREKKVGKYFLDFVINNVDLEIDGKQHRYKDRVESDILRDKFLTNEGYFVYRIEWNEINSINGKQMMKEKIDLFLDFLRSLNI